jgi:hypothetical protein
VDAAVEFLMEVVRDELLDAEAAIEAILRSMPSAEIAKRLEGLVAGNPRLQRVLALHQKTSS